MSNRVLEIRRRLDGVVAPGANLIFDEGRVASPEILYNGTTGIITFNITGQFAISWWVATEITPVGPIEFALISSQADYIWGSSPQKTGQVSGFGIIEVLKEGTTMELRNTANANNVLSREVTYKAYLLVTAVEAIGPTGPDGRSAYQVAVDKGYEGTEEEWLSGLIGPTGPQGANGTAGATGTTGATGATGADGRSAYQVAVDEGYKGTEEEWLERLVGPQGLAGPAFSTAYGVFWGYDLGPFTSSGAFSTIIPVRFASFENTPGAFALNADGSVTINQAGVYLITGRVLVAEGSAGTFNLQLNSFTPTLGRTIGSAVQNGGIATGTTVLFLEGGDIISNVLHGVATVNLMPDVSQILAPTSALTFVKIA